MNRKYSFWFALATFIFLFSSLVSAGDICIDNSPPSIPGNVVLSDSPFDSDGVVVISWSASKDVPNVNNPSCPGVAYYEIFQRNDKTSDFVKVGQTSDLSFTEKDLIEGLTYRFKVRAVDSVSPIPNYGDFSNEVSTTIASSYCGDGLCSNAESCSSCSADCGVCSSSPSSSSGTSGGGLPPPSLTKNNDDNSNDSLDVIPQNDLAPIFKPLPGNELNNDDAAPAEEDSVDDALTALPGIQGAVIGGGSFSFWPIITLGVILAGLSFLFVYARRRPI